MPQASSGKKAVVFVHGWSVHNTNTYGGFPARLQAEARRAADLELDVRHVWLGKYVSFRDEVRVGDLARGFEEAVQRELGTLLEQGRRFACITHSTGGPVVREWWDRYYVGRRRARSCPMSHLIMLAPANFGSALAALGKARIGRLKSWFEGVEPGTGVLDWLELGSPESWDLNTRWLDYPDTTTGRGPTFPFVLTGQRIDRAFYDNLNSYTGEIGSDGVVRVAAANLNCSYAKLVQEKARPGDRKHPWVAPTLRATGLKHARPTAFRLIAGSSHSGKDMGILRSVRNDQRPHPSVDAVLECLRVRTGRDYRALCERFDAANAELQKQELVEVEKRILKDRVFIHDPHSMVIFRVIDDHGQPVGDFDIRLTAGDPPDPNALPEGFFRDRQANRRGPGTITYFVNANVMLGADPVVDPRNEEKVLRDRLPGAGSLGFEVEPHRTDGFVHHLEATLNATRPYLRRFVRPNETTLVDIHMRRVVRRGVFELTKEQGAKDFKNQPKGEPLSRDRG